MEERKDGELPSDLLDRAEELIEKGDFYSAQHILSNIEEDSGRKHYLLSKIYKSEHWYNEQRKQLKKAVKAEPYNQNYRIELEELMEFRKTGEYQNTVKRPKKEQRQMGNTDGAWAECCGEVCGYLVCGAICDAIGNGC